MTKATELRELATVTTVDGSTGNVSISSDTLYVDAANNRVGIGTDSPATALDVTGTVTADELTVDNININGNTISSTDTNGDIRLDPDGTGLIYLTSSQVAVSNEIQVNNNTDLSPDSDGAGYFRLNGNGYAGALTLDSVGLHMYTNSTIRGVLLGTNETDHFQMTGSGFSEFNLQESTSADFRVRGNSITNLFYIDADLERIGIGAAPSAASSVVLQVQDNALVTDGTRTLILSASSTPAGSITEGGRINTSTAHDLSLFADGSNGTSGRGVKIHAFSDTGGGASWKRGIEFRNGNSPEVVVNEGGEAIDFRVEGDSRANMLFVDASTDRVGIGYSNPFYNLHSYGGNTTNYNTALVAGNGLDDSDTGNLIGVWNPSEVDTAYSGLEMRVENSSGTAQYGHIATVSQFGQNEPNIVIGGSNGSSGMEVGLTVDIAGRTINAGNTYAVDAHFHTGSSLTISDDAVGQITSGNFFSIIGVVVIGARNTSYRNANGIAQFRVTSSLICDKIASYNNDFATGTITGAPTGTTGTDGKVILWASTDGTLYIENRIGTVISVSFTLLGL